MNALIVHERAAAELCGARTWYDGQSQGLGDEFIAEIARSFQRLTEFPYSGQEIDDGIRQASLRRFPYSIIYGVEGDFIVIYAVAHQHRDPGYRRIH